VTAVLACEGKPKAERLARSIYHKRGSNMMKRYALLTIFVFCVFTLSCGNNDSSTANRVSKPGEYTGYSDAIYDDEYEITSQYVQVSDGTKLAMIYIVPRIKPPEM
jgi:hypothetical protein